MNQFSQIQKKSTSLLLKEKGLKANLERKSFQTKPKSIKLISLLKYSTKLSHKPLDIFPSLKNLESAQKNQENSAPLRESVAVPVNLLFSVDQFLFEFSKKTYQQQKVGEFFQRLKERKKFSVFYGNLTQKQMRRFFQKVEKTKGYFSKTLFSLLERRLDCILYRAGFAKTIKEAQQLIKHKKILVNSTLVTLPSYFLTPGEIISLNPKTAKSLASQLLMLLKKPNSKTVESTTVFKDFYHRFKKIHEKIPNKPFSSQILSAFFLRSLCTRIQLRSFISQVFFQNFESKQIQKTGLLFLKWKFLSCDFKLGSEKAVIWTENVISLKMKKILNSKTENLPQIHSKKNVSFLKFENKNELLSSKIVNFNRKSFLIFCKDLEKTEKFQNLISLNLQKFLFKNSQKKSLFHKKLHFREIKSTHYETSYTLLNIIYLYSPQRVNFPFFIDLDLIKRSFS